MSTARVPIASSSSTCITALKALISIRSRLTRNQLAFWMCWGHWC